ncbi:MAG TPA: hypothetical protein VK436_04420 [Methanocella sp.]|nr:hypothetical protein [Methanocella sp.]
MPLKYSAVNLYGIVAVGFFILTIALGYAIAARLKIGLSWMERTAASPILGIVVVTWCALLVYLPTGNMDACIGITGVLMLICIFLLRPWKTAAPSIERKHIVYLLIIIAASVIIPYFSQLTYYGGEYHIAYPLFGDAAFHASLVSSFSQGSNHPPQYPFMAGQPLRYMFLIDFYSGMLDHAGMGIQWSIVLPDIALLASLMMLLYSLGSRFTGGRAGGGLIAVAIVIFSGGFEFLQGIKEYGGSGLSLVEFLSTWNLNYTCNFDLNYVFTNFTDIVMAQRAALIGFAAGALTLLIFFLIYVDGKYDRKTRRYMLLLLGFIAGLLPLFHMYSYVCIMIPAVILFIIYRERDWYYFMLPAVLFAMPQTWYLTGQGAGSLIRLEPFWMAGSACNAPGFWIMNMGLELFLLVLGLAIAGSKKARFYLPWLVIFILANIVVFQAGDYDNHKFFNFWLMPSALFMATALLAIYDLRIVGKAIFAVVMLFTVLTGVLVVGFMIGHSYVEFTEDQVYVADWVSQNTPTDALFLTGDSPTHPVIALSGRMSYLGYYPWMYTHGIFPEDRVYNVYKIYDAESTVDMVNQLKRLNITYVALGPDEIQSKSYRVNQSLFDHMTPAFDWTGSTGDRYRIYRVA